MRDGVPVAIDFCNPAPDAEVTSVGQANFDWVVEAVSDMAIRKAREHQPGRDNLSWGKFVQAAVEREEFGKSVKPRVVLSDRDLRETTRFLNHEIPRVCAARDARLSAGIADTTRSCGHQFFRDEMDAVTRALSIPSPALMNQPSRAAV